LKYFLMIQNTKIEKSVNQINKDAVQLSLISYSLKICSLLMPEIKKILSLCAIFKQHNV